MKRQYWNIQSVKTKRTLNTQPLLGTEEKAKAYMNCTYDINAVKLIPVILIDLDKLEVHKKDEELIVSFDMCHKFTYTIGIHNHNLIKDEDTKTCDCFVEKDYFKTLNLPT